ncbi:cytoskeletal protein RodZ [Shimia isoporae]|uniref:Cytoskeletal protein RodZ n=1 Tax=Shimia isoporae TaxID=647720 RepID=A0A4R1NMS9_9RHOB|nr:cytoskeletal protein RodZ [Shimia isoporae]
MGRIGMIGRKAKRKSEEVDTRPKGYDDFDVRLGDMMRGERATMGKSLLDVQRELRIRAAYISAIENCDPSAFETPGFIAGYVRSYARYLEMDPEMAFEKFCEESGFSTAHGMSAEASTMRKRDKVLAGVSSDPFAAPNTPFAPAQDSILSRVEPRAIGSSLVLLALIAGIGYGGWSVLNEIQRVTLAPVEQAPVVLADLDPVSSAISVSDEPEDATQAAGLFTPPAEALDRLYRPQALDVPVLVARDAPISQLSPDNLGLFTPDTPLFAEAAPELGDLPVPKVIEDGAPEVVIMAVRPAWVRVRSSEGTVLFEKILDAGEEYVLPATEEAPTLRAGMSGSVYFKLNGEIYGPAGEGTGTVRDLALDVNGLRDGFEVADLDSDPELARIVALAAAQNVVVEDE